MITVLLWPKCIILVLKLPLVLELWVLLSSHRLPFFKHSLPTFVGSTALRKAHEDSEYTAKNAVMHWHLRRCQNHPGSKVVSAVIIFSLPFGCHCLLDSNSMVLTCDVCLLLAAYIITCCFWTKTEYELVQTVHAQVSTKTATRSAVSSC